jgi:hypothetical protein
MSDDDANGRTVSRRQALKIGGTVTGIGIVGGAGLLATGSANAQMQSAFNAASPGALRNDDGDIEEVFIAPKVYHQWSGFDEEPTKLRWVLEAAIEGEPYAPVYRETPFLFEGDEADGNEFGGTSGRYPESGRVYISTRNSQFYDVNNNGDFVSPDDGSQVVKPKTVLFKDGLDTYRDSAEDYPGGETYFTGASIGDDGPFANGKYGVLGDTSNIDALTDGSTKTTTIKVRLTTALLKTVEYENAPTTTETLMQEEYPAYGKDTAYTYARLRNIADQNPGVTVNEATFDVTAENIVAEGSVDGDANPGVN